MSDERTRTINSEPTTNRIIKDNGKNVSLKISIGKKKLHSDKEMARMFYGTMIINGAQYCRQHLMIRCHLCEVDNTDDEADDERDCLHLRPCGDARLNAAGEKWKSLVVSKTLDQKLQLDLLIQRYGKNHAQTNPGQWLNFQREASADERQINNQFLTECKELFSQGASQCCYWACDNPDAPKLLRCAGCKIAMYCCKDHQAKDWAWEHKGECQIPQFLKEEFEYDRQRHVAGDYTLIDR
jgi:hypothetical protein